MKISGINNYTAGINNRKNALTNQTQPTAQPNFGSYGGDMAKFVNKMVDSIPLAKIDKSLTDNIASIVNHKLVVNAKEYSDGTYKINISNGICYRYYGKYDSNCQKKMANYYAPYSDGPSIIKTIAEDLKTADILEEELVKIIPAKIKEIEKQKANINANMNKNTINSIVTPQIQYYTDLKEQTIKNHREKAKIGEFNPESDVKIKECDAKINELNAYIQDRINMESPFNAKIKAIEDIYNSKYNSFWS